MTVYLREAAADPPLREAVALSSPALARRWDEVCRDGSSVGAARLWRAARALTAYRLRMATRCTPFGLMAGVAAADIAAESGEAKVRFGGDHRRAVRSERDGSTPWWWTGSADRRCCAGSG